MNRSITLSLAIACLYVAAARADENPSDGQHAAEFAYGSLETSAPSMAAPADDRLEMVSLTENLNDMIESVGCVSRSHANVVCDCAKMQSLAKAYASAYQPLFYDNNFDYLCDPCYDGWWPGDRFKRVGIGNHMTLDVGGQYRARLMNERGMRGLGLTGNNDDFLLHRTRVFANLEVGRRFRAYVEYIDADSNYEDFPARAIEENRSDLLNAFGDLMLWDDCGGELWARAGRQELLYGAQRTVSPLDWANTRRTFQGYKAFWQGTDWNIDGFWTNPIDANTVQFDSPNDDEEFMGVYATYKGGRPGTAVDLYYLRLKDEMDQQGGAFLNNFDFHTIGTRIQGKRDWLLYEIEAAYQFGENTDGSSHAAGAFTVGVGRNFECAPWKPSVWVYYDWASGANQLGAGNGYHHMFPLAHKYLGFMDLFGRRNIESPNILVTASPHEKIKLLAWYYIFHLENINDTPYSVVMTPFVSGGNVAPSGSTDLGQELDLTLTYIINPRMNILFGYSHFFTGRYYDTTANAPTNADADFYYTQFEVNF